MDFCKMILPVPFTIVWASCPGIAQTLEALQLYSYLLGSFYWPIICLLRYTAFSDLALPSYALLFAYLRRPKPAKLSPLKPTPKSVEVPIFFLNFWPLLFNFCQQLQLVTMRAGDLKTRDQIRGICWGERVQHLQGVLQGKRENMSEIRAMGSGGAVLRDFRGM